MWKTVRLIFKDDQNIGRRELEILNKKINIMTFISKNDENKVIDQIKSTIKKKLLTGYKNQKGHLVEDVDEVIILSLTIDEEKSNRDAIVISDLRAGTRVWVRFHVDGKSNDSFQLRNDKPLVFIYSDDSKEYEFSNGDEVTFFVA